MSLTAYQTIKMLHEHFWEQCLAVLESGIPPQSLPVRRAQGRGGRTQKILAYGNITERPVYQSLSHSAGVYYLSTTFLDINGPHIPMSFRPQSGAVDRRTIKQSLFYQYLLLSQSDFSADDPEATVGSPYPWTFEYYKLRQRTT